VMGGDEEAGMDALSMSYTLGEASELWMEVYEPIRSGGASQ
jgi:m7GpppX diphosphatase